MPAVFALYSGCIVTVLLPLLRFSARVGNLTRTSHGEMSSIRSASPTKALTTVGTLHQSLEWPLLCGLGFVGGLSVGCVIYRALV